MPLISSNTCVGLLITNLPHCYTNRCTVINFGKYPYPLFKRLEKLIKDDMASCVEELHCLSYKWQKLCQNARTYETNIRKNNCAIHSLFFILLCHFKPTSLPDYTFIVTTAALRANAWHLLTSQTSHLPTFVKCPSGLTQQNSCQKLLPTRALIAQQYEPGLLNHILSSVWAIWKY